MNKKINQLKPHPKHSEIYYTPDVIKEDWKDLFESMQENGLLYPIIISKKNVIISGVRRWLVAKELGWNHIQVNTFKGKEDDIDMLIITSNSNREKTNAEKVNEALQMLKIIGNRQGRRNLNENEKGCKYKLVAKKLGAGFSKDNVYKLAKIEEHENQNQQKEKKLIELVRMGAPINVVYKLINDDLCSNGNDVAELIKVESTMSEKNYTITNCNCLSALYEMNDSQIDMIFTSPPYFSLRFYYGVGSVRNPNNIGEENCVEDYVKNLGKIGAEIFRVLKPKGSFFLNIGDTVENGENLAVPELLLVEMKRIGFKLANRIVWKKTNPKPMKIKSGFQPNYELIFHFVKQNDYKCRQLVWDSGEKIKITRGVGDRKISGEKEMKTMMLETPYRQFKTFYDENEGFTNIIKSAVATAKKLSDIAEELDHPALCPDTLGFLPMLQTTQIGDTVLDVFAGSSTMGVVANLFGRKYFGIEINKEYHRVGAIRMNDIQSKINPEIYEEMDRMAA
jgi:site-specific DNA-methyltransferase (adenine-specific)/site-specific DNA-methyltransferase (cytosine-N4-specific)